MQNLINTLTAAICGATQCGPAKTCPGKGCGYAGFGTSSTIGVVLGKVLVGQVLGASWSGVLVRYQVRDKVLSIGDDAWITDEQGGQAFFLDGKAMRVRQTYELKDPAGRVLLTVRKKLVSLRPTMVIEHDGATVARVQKKLFHLIGDRFAIEFEGGGYNKIGGPASR